MKAFLDTSVLVAVFYGDHVHHMPSLDLFTQFHAKEGCCAVHSLFEVYAAVTRMPGRHRVGADQAMLFVENIKERLTLVALTADEYASTIKAFAQMGIAGGAIYDALVAGCALKARAERLFTWNISHFSRLGPDVVPLLQTPG